VISSAVDFVATAWRKLRTRLPPTAGRASSHGSAASPACACAGASAGFTGRLAFGFDSFAPAAN
jgi:hypothetical protein